MYRTVNRKHRHHLWLTDEEVSALSEMSDYFDLDISKVIIQAIRFYQLAYKRELDGEKMTWTGDAHRIRDFSGGVQNDR